jgi:hypothetical protein
VCDIIMLIFGIITLVRGKFLLTRAKEVRGVPARIIGVILMLPLPLSFMAGLVLGAVIAAQGKNEDELRTAGIILGVSITAICFISAIVLAAVTAQPVVKEPSARRRKALIDDELPEEYGERFRSGAAGKESRIESEDITAPEVRRERPPDDRIQE